MKVRKANSGDISDLINCQCKIWESLRTLLPLVWVENELQELQEEKMKEHFKRLVQDPIRIILAAEENREIVGVAFGRAGKGGVSWLGFMGVMSSHRSKGIGKAILQRYIEESKRQGAHKISLNTAPQLKPAIRLYTGMGFIPEGLFRRHIYGVDLIIYSKFLD
ncbi:MAG: GNAT family N-acetyltransferase [Promethearchaeota archaeon]